QAAYDVTLDPDGHVWLTGFYTGQLNLGEYLPSADTNSSAFIAKFSDSENMGQHVWSERYGDAQTQTSWAIAADHQGDIVVTGSFAGAINFRGGDNETEA